MCLSQNFHSWLLNFLYSKEGKIKKFIVIGLFLALFAACQVSGLESEPNQTRSLNYLVSQEDFINPERGQIILYQPTPTKDGITENTPSLANNQKYILEQVNLQRTRLIRVVYTLSSWINTSISDEFLNRLVTDFDFVRQFGLKLVPYFVYNWPISERGVTDANAEQIALHLEQLKNVLNNNADVLAFMYAGFIGAWGEWHDSSQANINPDGSLNSRSKTILANILSATPNNRAVTLRYVGHKFAVSGMVGLVAAQAFQNSAQARLGFNNECYMADYHPDVKAQRLSQRAFLQQEGLFVPQVGLMDDGCFSFNNNTPQTVSCTDLLEELAMTRMDVVNLYPSRILGNCQPEVQRRLGYRFELQNSTMPDQVKIGAALNVKLSLVNVGFSPPFNMRKVELVLRHQINKELYRFAIASDPRFWIPNQTQNISLNIILPIDVVKGNYDVLLNLPDAAASLNDRPEYSIQLANQGVWEASTGFNFLRRTLHVY